MDVSPYDILDLPQNFTIDQLKRAYYVQAIKVHPDKGGSKEMFQLVTNCFRELYKKVTGGDGSQSHHELKAAFMPPQGSGGAETLPGFYNGKKFDNTKFQKAYDQVRPESVHDRGYIDDMSKEDIEQPKVTGKLSIKNLNKAFDKYVQPSSQALVVHKQPEAYGILTKLQFEELGDEVVSDFSGTLHSLNYSDFRVAHTTTRLVDPKTVKARPEFKSLKEYRAHRDSVKLEADAEEQAEQVSMEEQRTLQEEKRTAKVKTSDEAKFKYWAKVNQQLLQQEAAVV